jgi:hypothetical protein
MHITVTCSTRAKCFSSHVCDRDFPVWLTQYVALGAAAAAAACCAAACCGCCCCCCQLASLLSCVKLLDIILVTYRGSIKREPPSLTTSVLHTFQERWEQQPAAADGAAAGGTPTWTGNSKDIAGSFTPFSSGTRSCLGMVSTIDILTIVPCHTMAAALMVPVAGSSKYTSSSYTPFLMGYHVLPVTGKQLSQTYHCPNKNLCCLNLEQECICLTFIICTALASALRTFCLQCRQCSDCK